MAALNRYIWATTALIIRCIYTILLVVVASPVVFLVGILGSALGLIVAVIGLACGIGLGLYVVWYFANFDAPPSFLARWKSAVVRLFLQDPIPGLDVPEEKRPHHR
jgi:hypothetical protein